MSDDAGRGRPGGTPLHGRVGPADPTVDPVTEPGMYPVPVHDGTTGPVPTASEPGAVPAVPPSPSPSAPPPTAPSGKPGLRHSRTGGLWVGLILSALVLLILLVFILQNGDPVNISFFAFDGQLPTGVALLLAAIAGILLVAIPGSLRILQLRRATRRER